MLPVIGIGFQANAQVTPKVIAHRGYWDAPGSAQNSIRALVKADSIGCYGSEFDVWLTSDGVAVVNHDSTFKGVKIEDSPYSAVKNLKLSNGEKLPTLDEYLTAAEKLPNLRLVCELKAHSNRQRENAAVDSVLSAVKRHGLENRTDYISFSAEAFKRFIAKAPKGTEVYYLTGEMIPEQIAHFKGAGQDYHYSWFKKHPDWITRSHELGLKVNAWTVNRADDLQWCIDNDVDFITTNDPELLQKLIASNKIRHNYRIAVLSDIHVTPGNRNDSLLRVAVKEINSQPFDYVVVNGDLSNEGSDEQLKNVKAILDGLKAPSAILPGNHENNWSQSAGKTFFDLWGNDRFVVDVDSVLTLVGINCGPYMKMGDGHIKQEDLHWLDKTLAAKAAEGRVILNFNHYPIQDDLDNWEDYLAVLEKYPVIGHINGHYHNWKQYKAGNLPAGMTRALEMKGDKAGYAIIEIEPKWVKVYNKALTNAPEAKYAWPLKTSVKPFRRGEARTYTQPEGYEVTKVWADSASIFTRLGFDKENVYFGTSLGQARAVNKNNGTLKFSKAAGNSLFSRPVVLSNGNIAYPTATELLILSPDGRTVSSLKSKEGPYAADGTVDGNMWYQGGYKRFEARDAKSGKLIWEYDSIFNYCQAAPAIGEREIVFGAWDTNLRSLDKKTGRLNWVWNNGKTANMLGPGNVVPVIAGERVYVVAPDRFMTALDRKSGRQLWRNKDHKYRESLGHSEDYSRIYAKTMDGELTAVDATSPEFKELWTLDMGIGYEHAPCLVVEKNGIVYAGSRQGILSMVDPVEKKVVASLPLGVSEINGIDIDPTTGDIYVSLIEGTIFRIKKK